MIQCRLFFRKGNKLNLPKHAPIGEPLYCVDTNELYVGMGDSLPPQPIQDQTKWLIEKFESFGVGLSHKESININSLKKVKLSAMMDSEKPIVLELGSDSVNGRPTYAIYPICHDFSTEPYVDLGTQVNPFQNIWVGSYEKSNAKNVNTLTNGFTEQWGKVSVFADMITTIQLPLSYTDLSYNIQITLKSDRVAQPLVTNVKLNSFDITVAGASVEVYWRTIGTV